ncbi:MAG: hypothetical protein C4K49_04760, partial [Candidatus Thorarchaeota archaeon]
MRASVSDTVLIIGAGVAGMTAAVELADSGIRSVLVERASSMGGNALDLYKAFPTDDCFYCFEGNRWRPGIRKCFYRSAMVDQPNIEIKMGAEVKEIAGGPGDFKVRIAVSPTYVDPRKCTLCGLCSERSKAFHLLSPQCQPQAVTYDSSMADDGTRKAEEDCPTKAIKLDAQPSEETIGASDIVIATGYHEMKPIDMQEYGYGRIPNVITQLELAQMLDPNGKSGGVLLRPSDGAGVKQVMMVQCVGSRDEEHHPYCSKVCCVFALKHANIIATERQHSRVSVVYMDIRTYDRHERYYRESRDAGVEFIRGRVTRVEPRKDGAVNVTVYDSLLDKYLRSSVDLL